jgi:structural maintenance of chromosome 4
MRGQRRRRQTPESDDENSRSPAPSRPVKKRRVQQQSKEPTPALEEQTQIEESEQQNNNKDVDLYSEELLNMIIPECPEPTMSTDSDAPRLIITKIDVENFKSYYGKQTLGPFHKVNIF